MDGEGRLIRLRISALEDGIMHVCTLARAGDLRGVRLYQEIFQHLRPESISLWNLFVKPGSEKEVVVVFSNVSPMRSINFFTHLILTRGKFDTELDVFGVSNMRLAFYRAGMIPDGNNITEADARAVILDYVQDQLMHLPLGSRVFGRYLGAAYDSLYKLLVESIIEFPGMPLVSDTKDVLLCMKL